MESVAILLKKQAGVWSRWWLEQAPWQKVLPAAVAITYWSALSALGGLRGDHLVAGIALLLGSYGGPFARSLLRFFLPLLLIGAIYDSQRFFSHLIERPVHVEEPYNFDKVYFGIPTANGILTPNEWFQLHTHPILDFITGFFYLTFVPIFLGIAALFQFWYSRAGTPKLSAKKIRVLAPAVMWSFFWVNLAGYLTYYLYSAAPPWYVTLHGLGPALMDTPPNAAGCVRFDQLLGTNFFAEWYGRSADVFGAIPSLHVAYPLQAVYYSQRFGALRRFSIFFYLIMCFSAVYLNHHYVLDVLLGSIYAIVVCRIVNPIYERKLALQSVRTSEAQSS